MYENRPYEVTGLDGNVYHLKNDYTKMKFGYATPITIDHKDKEKNKIFWLCKCDCGNEFVTDAMNFIHCKDTLNCGCKSGNNKLLAQRFGDLVITEVLGEVGESSNKLVKCKCDCGGEIETKLYMLYRGSVKNCGCKTEYDNGIKKYIGQKYHNLTIEDYIGSVNKRRVFKCRCDCGNVIEANSNQLIQGIKQDCGCGISGKFTRKKASIININSYIGKKYGKLTITGGGELEKGKRYFTADCDCGTKNIKVRLDRLNDNSCCNNCKNTNNISILNNSKLNNQMLKIKYYFTENGRGYYMCDCACGNTDIKVRTDMYKSGATRHCGCQKIGLSNYVGKRFGKLIVNNIKETLQSGETIYNCTCDCGNTCEVKQSELRSGKTKSCGCIRSENAAQISQQYVKTHGDKGTKLYQAWSAMKYRCNNPNSEYYHLYGGRGIKVCPEWDGPDGYIKFKEDMYESYLNAIQYYGLEGQEHKLSIDRIDVNKGYCKENCRWVTMKEQANNKTNNTYIEYYGRNYTVSELYDKFIDPNLDITYSELLTRIKNGWNIYDAINIPNLNMMHCNSIIDYYNKFGKPLIKPIRFIDDTK